METLNNNNMKRKKRKTRRCLDELRKKTQQTNGVCTINKNADAKMRKSKSNYIKNNCITSNRLTLIKKAVRSETVTRLQLSESEGKKLKSNKDGTTIIPNFGTNTVSPIELNNKLVLETQNQDITEDNSEIKISSPILTNEKRNNEMETPKSVILFSPESQNREAFTTNLDSPLETSSISSSSSTINISYEPNFAGDIMDQIEIYLQENVPNLPNPTDLIKKEIAKLKKIRSESEYQTEKNLNGTLSNSQIMSQNVSSSGPYSSPEVAIIHNPKDYLGYRGTSFSESNNSEHSQSPMESTSSSSISIHIPSTSPLISAVYDTPEYSYYPHRLNN